MCHGTSTLFHGLFVTTSSLFFAAQAHQQTHGPRCALDTIMLRWRSGTLDIDSSKSQKIKEIPLEVWESIKGHLIANVVDEVERELIDDLRCGFCNEKAFEESWKSGSPEEVEVEHFWTRWEAPECNFCSDIFYQHGWDWIDDVPGDSRIDNLLHAFGLCRPSKEVWKDNPDDLFTPKCLSGVAVLSPSSADGKFPEITAPSAHEMAGPGSGVAVFAADYFTSLPSNTRLRFKRLLDMYQLKAVYDTNLEVPAGRPSSSPSPSPSPKSKPATSDDSNKQQSKREAKPLYAADEPRWIMWVLEHSCV